MSNLLILADDPRWVAGVVDEARREVRYLVTDFPVELIATKYSEEAEAEGDIYVPDYQRGLAWTEEQGSYFIESLILRVPIPPIFLYDVEGLLEIVDGSQRIRSLVKFLNDEYPLQGLEKLEILNGYRFTDLPSSIQRRLHNTPIRSFVMDESTDQSTRIDLFRRLNTSGKKLEDAEIRKGAFQGPFLDLIIECTNNETFLALTKHMKGKPNPESEHQELVTRFFVYTERYLDFKHDVRKFLDRGVIDFNKTLTKKKAKALSNEFDRTMSFVLANYPRGFYRSESSRTVPRVRFEAVAVGTNLALRKKPNPKVRQTDWLRNKEFQELVRTDASNSAPKLKARIEYVRDHILGEDARVR
ncbi:MAG: DUF262 domain-containing protein [Allosphingosinicella sp.]